MAPIIQIEEAQADKRHSLHARGINQFSRSPILIHKRHDAAWRARQAQHRKAKHSKTSKTYHKTSKHRKHKTHKHVKHHKSSHRSEKSSHHEKKKASLGHTSGHSKDKSSGSKSGKKIMGGSDRATQPNKGNDKEKEQKSSPRPESKAKVPGSHVVSKGIPKVEPKVAPAHTSSDLSLAKAGGIDTSINDIYSSWSNSAPTFNNRPAQELPASNPERMGASKVIGLSLAPLAVLVAMAYGVVTYRRRAARRNHRRQVLLDAEAAAAAATSFGSDDDEGSLMSAVSYRPPGPFTSEVDVSTDGSINSDPELVVGDSFQHQIPAPQRDASRTDIYQDYSHVCQSQILGQTCTNHSIRCFVALNHSNAGLDVPESKTPAAYRPDHEMSSTHTTMDSALS
ncbi:hypothetical protein MVEG_04408 [Podila verticillata NRRL 6337]|nr:hypothetical protein MVEG_04408 [Podila verticillata NRRL 6337]